MWNARPGWPTSDRTMNAPGSYCRHAPAARRNGTGVGVAVGAGVGVGVRRLFFAASDEGAARRSTANAKHAARAETGKAIGSSIRPRRAGGLSFPGPRKDGNRHQTAPASRLL